MEHKDHLAGGSQSRVSEPVDPLVGARAYACLSGATLETYAAGDALPAQANPNVLGLMDAVEQARAEAPGTTVEPHSQDWAGMDGTTAYHLIQRHSDNWADVALMMGEWLEANVQIERERCATLCDAETKIAHGEFGAGWVEGARTCAAAIRQPTAATPQP